MESSPFPTCAAPGVSDPGGGSLEDFSTSHGGDGSAEGPGTANETDPRVEAQLALLICEASALLQRSTEDAVDTETIKEELASLSAHYAAQKPEETLVACLETGSIDCQNDMAPHLMAFIEGVTGTGYQERQVSKLRQDGGDKLQKWSAKRQVGIAAVLSAMMRQVRQAALPPQVLLRSVQHLHYGTNRSHWRLQCSEKHVASETLTERLVEKATQIYKPWNSAFGRTEDLEEEYRLVVADNFELWTRKTHKQRLDAEGDLLVATVFHTVTSKSHPADPPSLPPAVSSQRVSCTASTVHRSEARAERGDLTS
jgi:hypothetical protein